MNHKAQFESVEFLLNLTQYGETDNDKLFQLDAIVLNNDWSFIIILN